MTTSAFPRSNFKNSIIKCIRDKINNSMLDLIPCKTIRYSGRDSNWMYKSGQGGVKLEIII